MHRRSFLKLGALSAALLPLGALSRLPRTAAAAQADGSGVLLFTIGMHIEPLGATVSALAGGGARPPGAGPSYHTPQLFQRHVQDIRTVTGIIERHGGRMTVQAQTPFTTVAAAAGETLLGDLERRGHEPALHFHEDAHLGRNPEPLPVTTWCAVMNEEIAALRAAGVTGPVRYWSGGNLYPGVLDAAVCAGLDVNSDWKNPQTQRTDSSLTGVHPWRPAGGPSATDLAAFARHDPAGRVIFLPEGQYDREDFASSRRGEQGDQAYFDYLRLSLVRSLAAARADRVNVFHFTVHPGEFRGDARRPFSVIDRFLTDVVDPLVAAGRVRWATLSQMADAFAAWERDHPGVDPRGGAAATPPGYMTFAVNVHDTTHPEESADTVLRLVDLFERSGTRGDFYVTAEIVRLYAERRPEVIARLRDSDMTISYHVRAPHPFTPGFEGPLRGLEGAALLEVARAYETRALDPRTGGLLDTPGGYRYVAETFGRLPVVVGAATGDRRIRQAALQVYREMGARMVVQYHECCADPQQPLVYVDGLLVRPSDFSITRWTADGEGAEQFWWNQISGPHAAAFDPVQRLRGQLAAWPHARPPFATALIHENNFVRAGPEGWTLRYYTDRDKDTPRTPPYDLTAPDLSRVRSPAERAAIWAAYERLLGEAATRLRVVTSADILAAARQPAPDAY